MDTGSEVQPFENLKKFHIRTFGCQMNVADTEKMAALLENSGMSSTDEAEDADLILINGCSVREKAVHKAVSALGVYRPLKEEKGVGKKKSGPMIGVGGCVGQLEKKQLFQRAPFLDFVFGPDAIDQLPEIIFRVKSGETKQIFTDFDQKTNYSTETKIQPNRAQAFVNIMKGCDKFCTYCIVPYTRGREKSRTIDEVVNDVAKLVSQGVKEVTLLGQNVNSFGKGNKNLKERSPVELNNPIGRVGPRPGDENFPQLLRAIDEDPRCESLELIRFTSSHPLDFSDELIDCYLPPEKGGVKRLAKHLHLPVQSGSNRVLRKMGRHHKIETYIEQMKRLKNLCPDVGMSTDLIVGFPTETEEEFQETMKLLDEVQYDSIYAFAYSPRPGTRASKLEDDISHEDKMRRLNQLLDHQKEIGEKTYASRVGKTFRVLVENLAKMQKKASSPEERVWTGRSSCNRVVNFVSQSPRSLVGQFVEVQITQSTPLSLFGELIVNPLKAEEKLS
ncbi:MAG: tRNA (N6-isopentenyl adenosine(37)-C2)-methylthiotransferase MiaB [Bdellovibrionaceae bacterium]|nr:tRNA (N6-isopentenyl adenosine(37)-C2)-methylthiotransferase MiaB [Pseudobdellovibrionaceae bacterium]|tara:strand:+ start:4069 stop:5580 length:1512 start_codon:yes stop_codon:yes gene_type:complete